jgi:2-(1,2-epoxy-1,2-dihydrophenyl)acetyl-CoA isomerase
MSLTVRTEDGVAFVTLDRPDVLNAFDEVLGRELLDVIGAASSNEEIRCIVMTGAGRAFSAGEDLGALMSHYEAGRAPDHAAILSARYNPLIRALRGAPKPIVAAVNGVAAGAGASIALACDFRVASQNAKLVFAFTKVGLVPDSAAAWLLARMVGEATALELVTTGRTVTADEALKLGLFTSVVAPDELDDSARALATGLARGPVLALALTKKLVLGALDRSLDEQLAAEVDAQAIAGRSEDHLEGMRAFLAKRPARFGLPTPGC